MCPFCAWVIPGIIQWHTNCSPTFDHAVDFLGNLFAITRQVRMALPGIFAEISAAANLAGMAALVFVMRAGEKSHSGLAGLHGSLSFSLAGPFLEACACK
jgi:hypothetical protein